MADPRLTKSILGAMRNAKMPARSNRVRPPSLQKFGEACRVVRDLSEIADWFHVPRETLDEWIKEKPEYLREWRRAKIEDLTELRLILREKAVTGSIQAAEKYIRATFPDVYNEKANTLHVTTEVRVLPQPDREPLIIDHEPEIAGHLERTT